MESPQDYYELHELQWQLYTKAGNQRMQANLYLEAQQAYNRAFGFAQLLLEEAKINGSHSDAIHPYVVSCHNLADNWLSLKNIQQAETTLQQAFNQVVQIMNDHCLSNSLRLEAFKALRAVSFEIDAFYRNLDQVAQAEATFQRSIALAQNFLAHFDYSQAVSLDDCQPHDSS
jgi:tetratricopeptide (TPR) repeat protein